VTIEVCDLGDWGAASLLAEYDPSDDAIRVNVRVVERVRAVLGDDAAQAFIACAVAHERFHREHPGASEDQAHASAREQSGSDPRAFEAVLR
jgi:hypothetical protein